MDVQEYSLREKKHARTKIAIMNAFIKRLEKTRFSDISIRQICKNVEVSEGTFFNYFPEKIDIIDYYMNLMFLKIVWKARKDVAAGSYIHLINSTFETTAEELLINNNIMYQIIALMIVQQEKPKTVDISDLERHIFLPGCDGIEHINIMTMDDFYRECLEKASKNNELPRGTNIDDLLISLMSILGGTLLAAKFTAIKDRAYHFRRQLRVLWESLGIKKSLVEK